MGWSLGIVWLIIMSLIIQPIIWIGYGKDEIKEVSCYDSRGNEILGQKCIQNIPKIDSLGLVLFMSILFEILIILMGLLLFGGSSNKI